MGAPQQEILLTAYRLSHHPGAPAPAERQGLTIKDDLPTVLPALRGDHGVGPKAHLLKSIG